MDLDKIWGAVGLCRAGRLNGYHIWAFTWRPPTSTDGELLAWELRICPKGVPSDDKIEQFEYLFTDLQALEEFAAINDVRWLPREDGIKMVAQCFPWEAGRIRARND